MAIWKSFREGLEKTRTAFAQAVGRGRTGVNEALEEALLSADLGWEATEEILAGLRGMPPREVVPALRQALLDLSGPRVPLHTGGRPSVIVFVGANGSGKTTTLGKLAVRLEGQGKRVLVAAADTFRAAATDQVGIWARRAGADIVSQGPGADAAAVAFDALKAAEARRADVLLVDTAGRLHNRLPLMEELKKVLRVLERELGRPPDETLLVLDGTTGQNALHQGRHFMSAVPLTGLVATKLDASAKGGAVLAARRLLGVPVKLVGFGEDPSDLADFDPELFVDGLLEGVRFGTGAP